MNSLSARAVFVGERTQGWG